MSPVIWRQSHPGALSSLFAVPTPWLDQSPLRVEGETIGQGGRWLPDTDTAQNSKTSFVCSPPSVPGFPQQGDSREMPRKKMFALGTFLEGTTCWKWRISRVAAQAAYCFALSSSPPASCFLPSAQDTENKQGRGCDKVQRLQLVS